jgi:hypothetical protein
MVQNSGLQMEVVSSALAMLLTLSFLQQAMGQFKA